MEHYELIPDMYRVILEYLDFSTKLNYVDFLKNTLNYELILNLENPNVQDIINIYSGDHAIEDVILLIKYNGIFTVKKWWLTNIYIQYFDNVEIFISLLKIVGNQDKHEEFDECIRSKNIKLFQYLHNTYGYHYAFKSRLGKRMYDLIKSVGCNICLDEFNNYNHSVGDGPVGPFGSRGPPGPQGPPGVSMPADFQDKLKDAIIDAYEKEVERVTRIQTLNKFCIGAILIGGTALIFGSFIL